PMDHEGRVQPLAAIYDRVCLPAIEEMLGTQRLRVDKLFELLPTFKTTFDQFADLTFAEWLFRNINSSKDWPSA
ncbi:MAG: molybdenum cofactor guanylyltransferase, partial [Blastocatellia bacterium]